MRFAVRGLAENILFALNIFIVFLLLFGDKISVPIWLQPLGRMHPMILHFPIVLLMLAMLLEFFRFKQVYNGEKLYQRFTTGLLLTGVLLSAVTVVMGLFLSKEEGYAGDALWWHKWTGVTVVFVSSAIYWSRNKTWYKAPLAKAGAVMTTFCLIVAGHYGATLTHGDNYVLEPVTSAKQVPVDQAIVFEDVVMPIFSEKCLGCHNLDKAKGSLIMDNARSLLKGGKTGKLFVAGKPEISLLLERVHLPVEDKKHMPPKNKTQLTSEETTILRLWIKGNAELKKKVVDLPQNDSLRMLATALLGPEKAAEEKFDFAAADDAAIAKLNNDYRVITSLAKNSPALVVNLYNKSIYNAKQLEELDPVKKQIVSLNLNNLPVKDEDLKIIAKFGNLRTLHLNSTDITGAGLKHLSQLKNLKELTLWKTKANQAEIKVLSAANGDLKIIGGI
ncbi:DUF2231 domain-containing protein [Pedobacter psychroterrae]|uniref:Uncharacterized protein n=1 Tax=Pedobacter psychroterrae TaxID=2530453 RepID=A0A4R0NU06_9SPHI|nr:DUF2231 domain-containing protein [Pedobacter psychroterrae]TCD02514.1 hypothetical protein EZ437_00560 [Pedobacter psychroterrae]